jgi:hypothetical protein
VNISNEYLGALQIIFSCHANSWKLSRLSRRELNHALLIKAPCLVRLPSFRGIETGNKSMLALSKHQMDLRKSWHELCLHGIDVAAAGSRLRQRAMIPEYEWFSIFKRPLRRADGERTFTCTYTAFFLSAHHYDGFCSQQEDPSLKVKKEKK